MEEYCKDIYLTVNGYKIFYFYQMLLIKHKTIVDNIDNFFT